MLFVVDSVVHGIVRGHHVYKSIRVSLEVPTLSGKPKAIKRLVKLLRSKITYQVEKNYIPSRRGKKEIHIIKARFFPAYHRASLPSKYLRPSPCYYFVLDCASGQKLYYRLHIAIQSKNTCKQSSLALSCSSGKP